MNEENYYWVWLSKIEKISAKEKWDLVNKYHSPKEIWDLSKEKMKKAGLSECVIKELINPSYKIKLEKSTEYMKENNITILNVLDNRYPKRLKNIYDPPIVLYAMGKLEILQKYQTMAIVGCRDATIYGKRMAKKFAYELTKFNINIISGMAKGIDTFAHIGAIEGNGNTIAVLGSGIDIIYPYENKKLYETIIQKNGVVISEYPVGTKPIPMHFPARNRIVSGLSDGVLVIEAKEKSGSFITVDLALEQGKNIYAIPGNINSINSIGTNELIKQGAKMTTNVLDIIEEIKLQYYFTH